MSALTWQEVFPVRSRRGAVACGVIGWALGLALDAISTYALHYDGLRSGMGGFGLLVFFKSLFLVFSLMWATRQGKRADEAVTSGAWFNVVWLWWVQVGPSLWLFLTLSIGWLLKEKQ